MSVHQLSWGATALGGMLIGFLAQLAGAPFALTLGGLITALLAGGLVLARLRELAGALTIGFSPSHISPRVLLVDAIATTLASPVALPR